MEVMEEYDPDTDQMLFYLPLTGSTFKKVYFDPTKQRAVSKFVPAEDLVVPYSASDLMTAERVTHVVKMTYNDIRKLQVAGVYRDVELSASDSGEDEGSIQGTTDELQGLHPGYSDDVYTIWKSMWISTLKALKTLMELCYRISSQSIKILTKFYRWLGTIGARSTKT